MKPATIKPEETCPIRDTHTRLHQCHRLWHQTQAEYADPDAFCTNLNATIQALRSVTFILQKEQAAIPDFEPWYDAWRERMKDDALMRWLVDARNRIEKQGDLKTYSSARVSVLADWNDPYPMLEGEVDPLMPTSVIVERLPDLGLPPELKREGVLIVERRWAARELPDHELLDALAHCYGVLATVVADAHARCGSAMLTFKAESHEPRPVRTEHLGGQLPCMVATAEARTVRIHLPTGKFLAAMQLVVKADPRRKDEVLKRYGTTEGSLGPRDGEDVIAASRRWFDDAKRVLATDGRHVSLAFLHSPDGDGKLHFLGETDRAGLYVMMRQLADEVERSGAVGVILIAEFWTARQDELKPGQRPSDLPKPREALRVIAATADGRARAYGVDFRKNEQGQIEFGEEGATDDPGSPNFLEPIRRVWRRWAEQGRNRPGQEPAGGT